MTAQTDAVQLARCVYIGNWDSFWSTLNDYTDTTSEPINNTSKLVLHLCMMINSLHRGELDIDPQAWFDTEHQIAVQVGSRGLE